MMLKKLSASAVTEIVQSGKSGRYGSQKCRVDQLEDHKTAEGQCFDSGNGVDQIEEQNANGASCQGENCADAGERTGHQLHDDAALSQRMIFQLEPGIFPQAGAEHKS